MPYKDPEKKRAFSRERARLWAAANPEKARRLSKILIACVLVGSWEFAGAVHAPQFGTSVNETMKVSVCPHPGGPRYEGDPEPLRPSTGIRIERELVLGDRPITVNPEDFCFVDGKQTDSAWPCPGLRDGYWSGVGAGGP